MKWYNVETVEQLKSIGKFREVSKIVKNDCGKIINVKLGSWKNLYNSIIELKQLIHEFEGDINEGNINSNANGYFISKASEYIFYLVELDGKERMERQYR